MTLTVRSPERLRQRPAAVLVDLDDTLYPYAPAHEAALAAAREKARHLLSVPEGQFDALYAEARGRIREQLGGTAASHSRLLYFQRVIELLGLGTQVLPTMDLEQTYWRRFLTASELCPGAKAFLGELRSAGIQTALVTDLTAGIQFRKLVYLEIDRDFDFIITSEEAGTDKPSAAMFQLARQKMGLSEGTLWMLGDHPEADIAGAAESLGAVTFQRRVAGTEPSQRADALFDHFDELRELLARILESA